MRCESSESGWRSGSEQPPGRRAACDILATECRRRDLQHPPEVCRAQPCWLSDAEQAIYQLESATAHLVGGLVHESEGMAEEGV